MTESQENYLKTIGGLIAERSAARVVDIAREVGVSKAAVHLALHELESKGLVRHDPYGKVLLTPKGASRSRRLRERHRLLTRFLVELLGVDSAVAGKEACAMEHDLSDDTLRRIAALSDRQSGVTGARH